MGKDGFAGHMSDEEFARINEQTLRDERDAWKAVAFAWAGYARDLEQKLGRERGIAEIQKAFAHLLELGVPEAQHLAKNKRESIG